MASGNMTVTIANVHIPDVWPGAILRAQEFNLVIAPRVYRDWKFAGFGDVYHVPRIPNIESQTKSAGAAWTPTVYTDTEQTLTINVHDVAGFEIEAITEVLSKTALRQEMQKKIGYSLGRAVDVALCTLPQNFSQIVGVLGNELVYDNMVAVWKLFAAAGIDMNNDCTWYLSPGAIAGLLKQDVFINQLYAGEDTDPAVKTAKVGQVLGAPILMSNLTRAPAGGQSESFAIYRMGIALIMAQQPKMVFQSIAKDIADVVGSYQIYGYTEVDRYDETPGNITATDNMQVLLRTVA